MFADMDDLRRQLHIVAQRIAPYHSSLDFSDPRNSGYVGLLFDI
jgi:hypothetical protein